MKHVAFAAAALLLLCAAPAAALTPHSPVLIQDDAGQPQSVKAGEDFFIALPSNVTTGFAWSASVGDEKLVAYEGNVYQRPPSARPGAGGQQLFIFHANRSGTTIVTFRYARPFESNSAPGKTLTYTISVE